MGSKACADAQIFLLPQAWAAIAGVAGFDMLVKAMDSVKERLATDQGIVLHDPAFRTFDTSIGGATLYLPGLKENAAVFCHSNPWAVIAEAKLGRGDRAYRYHKDILPSAKNDISDIRRTEPYVYCQMIAGKESACFGEGKNSWLTGTAAWSLFAATAYILGIRAEYKGLTIDPAIPPHWKEFSIKRKFRNAEYDIHVSNSSGVCRGVASIRVNGVEIEGTTLPYADGRKYAVEAVMG